MIKHPKKLSCKQSVGNSAVISAGNSPGNVFPQINPQETCIKILKKIISLIKISYRNN
jgi:hypothetical protein